MKRSFVVACALALTLALGLSASAGAGVSAEASAKTPKKGKGCKGKAKQPKAGKSAAAQAAKKGKGKPCKAKGKGTDKATPAPTPTPTPPPAPAPPAAAPFSDGTYSDPAARLELSVAGGATTATLKYSPPGGCVGINYTSLSVPLTKSGDAWTASETRAYSFVGDPANVKWDLTVKESGLTYALNFTMEANSMIGLCKWEGHPTGTLTKAG